MKIYEFLNKILYFVHREKSVSQTKVTISWLFISCVGNTNTRGINMSIRIYGTLDLCGQTLPVKKHYEHIVLFKRKKIQ